MISHPELTAPDTDSGGPRKSDWAPEVREGVYPNRREREECFLEGQGHLRLTCVFSARTPLSQRHLDFPKCLLQRGLGHLKSVYKRGFVSAHSSDARRSKTFSGSNAPFAWLLCSRKISRTGTQKV